MRFSYLDKDKQSIKKQDFENKIIQNENYYASLEKIKKTINSVNISSIMK